MATTPFPSRPYNLRAEAWVVSQDIASNTTVVGWQLAIDKTGYSPTFSGSGKANRYISVNGTLYQQIVNGFDYSGAGPWLLNNGTTTVAHNADGTKTIAITAQADYDILGTTAVISFNLALPTIARASVATFSPSSNLTTGTAVTINTNRASAGFTHDITWGFGHLSGQTTGLAASTGVGASTTWTPPDSMFSQVTSGTVGTGSITVVTKNGSTVVGTRTTAFTVTAGPNVAPTWGSVSQADPVTSPVNIPSVIGAYVQGLSKVRGAMTGESGVHGSTITSKKFTVAGQVVPISGTQADTPNPITATGTVPVTFELTDSRGRTKTQTNNITVLPYAPPTYSNASITRANSAGTVDVNGTYIRVNLSAVVQSLMVSATEKNRLTIRAYTSPRGANTWTLRHTAVSNSTTLTYNTPFWFTMSGGFLVNTSYDVRIEVADQLGIARFEDTLTIGGLLVDFNTGLGILKEWTQGAIDVDGDIYANGAMLLPGASTAETQAGTIANKAVTPAALSARTATETRSGILEVATAAETRAGSSDARIVTPLKLYNSPIFRVMGSSNQAAAASTWTLVNSAWATPQRNSGFTSWSGGALTVAQAGTYQITLQVSTGTIAANRFQLRVSLNSTNPGSAVANNIVLSAPYGTNGGMAQGLVQLAAGAVIRPYFWSAVASTIDGNALTYFEVSWVRP